MNPSPPDAPRHLCVIPGWFVRGVIATFSLLLMVGGLAVTGYACGLSPVRAVYAALSAVLAFLGALIAVNVVNSAADNLSGGRGDPGRPLRQRPPQPPAAPN